MTNLKEISIATLLIALIGSGSYALFTNIDFSKPVYYCENRIEIGPQYCVRFSPARTRCYPYTENTIGYRDCSIGWTKITKGMEIPIENTPEQITIKGGMSETCYPKPIGCVPNN